jgi:drug/metabolite transporter (DMT)-like permease
VSGEIRILGLLALGLATFGAAPILVRLAGADADPIAITTVRTVVAALVLLPLWWWHPLGRASTPRDAGGSWRWSILSGLFLALHFTLWVASLGYTSVASASVLVTCHPVLLIVIESVLFRVAFRRLTWLGVLIAFGGTVLLALSDRTPATTYTDPLLGNLLAFVAALLFVGYILISQRIRRLHSWLDYVGRVYLATAVFTVLIFVLTDRSLEMLTPAVLTSGVLLALGAQLLGHGALNYAVKFVAPTLLSTLILAEPLIATLLAVALLGEVPAPLAAVAMVLTLGGILLSWWGRRARPG